MMAKVSGPRVGPAQPAVVTLCPNVILAGLALLSLLLTVRFGSLAALGFLVSGLLLWGRKPSRALEDALRFWPVFLVPFWCLLSWFWSAAPSETMRYGLQLAITFLVAVAMATRLSARNFVLVAFACFAIVGMASLLFGSVRSDGAGWLGIFGSKNAFSFAMSNLVLLSFCLVVAGGERSTVRLAGLGGLGLGLFLLVMGQSAGAVVSTALAFLLGLGLVVLRSMPPAQRLVAMALALLAAFGLGLLAFGFRAELAAELLESTGKDPTLTGRTVLWNAAFSEIARHPLLGQGFRAVWIPGHPVAEAMWAEFGIASKSGFNFHNTWISNAVEIGLIGMTIEAALFATTLVLAWRWALAAPGMASLFFLIFVMRQLALSLFEVVAYNQFHVDTMLMVAALVFGLRVVGHARSQQLSPAAQPAQTSGRALVTR